MLGAAVASAWLHLEPAFEALRLALLERIRVISRAHALGIPLGNDELTPIFFVRWGQLALTAKVIHALLAPNGRAQSNWLRANWRCKAAPAPALVTGIGGSRAPTATRTLLLRHADGVAQDVVKRTCARLEARRNDVWQCPFKRVS
jgi:hypothetical protein